MNEYLCPKCGVVDVFSVESYLSQDGDFYERCRTCKSRVKEVEREEKDDD